MFNVGKALTSGFNTFRCFHVISNCWLIFRHMFLMERDFSSVTFLFKFMHFSILIEYTLWNLWSIKASRMGYSHYSKLFYSEVHKKINLVHIVTLHFHLIDCLWHYTFRSTTSAQVQTSLFYMMGVNTQCGTKLQTHHT